LPSHFLLLGTLTHTNNKTQQHNTMSTAQQQLSYPLIAMIGMGIGKKGNKKVVRAWDVATGKDITSMVVYVTLQSAHTNSQWLAKMTADDRWHRIPVDTKAENLDMYLDTKSTSGRSVGNKHAKVSSVSEQGSLDRKQAANLISQDTMLQMIHQSVFHRPDTLICKDLTWKVICRNIVRGRNTLLLGPTGTGKSQTGFAAAEAMGRKLFYINLGSTQDPRGALIGNTHFSKDTGTFFNPSAFVTALQTENTVVVLDELSRAHPEAANILMTVLDPDQRYIRLDEQVGTPTIKVHPTVAFIATANIGSEYTATRVMDRALLDRFQMIEIPFLDSDQESLLISKRFPTLTTTQVSNLAEIAKATRDEIGSESPKLSTAVSTRSVLEIAGLLSDGFTLTDCAEVAIYPLYSKEGGIQSERTYIKQMIQKYVDDGSSDQLIPSAAQTDNKPF